MKSIVGRSSRIAGLAIVGTIVIGVLAGCVGAPVVEPSGPTGTPGPNAGPPSPTSNPTIEPTVPAGGTAVTFTCSDLLPAQAIYDYNPNYGLITGYSPPAGSAAATAVSDGGIACQWFNQTSGDQIVLGASNPGASALTALEASAGKGTPIPQLGQKAYFAASGGVGRADVFAGPYWLVITSPDFGSAGDASPLLKQAVQALPSG